MWQLRFLKLWRRPQRDCGLSSPQEREPWEGPRLGSWGHGWGAGATLEMMRTGHRAQVALANGAGDSVYEQYA